MREPGKQLIYIGTYTHGDSEGIYRCQMDTTTGELAQLSLAGRAVNPSYLAIDAERRRLFAVNELSEFMGGPGGSVSAFAIETSDGSLTMISQVSSRGTAPCYITVDETGRHLLLVNYVGGNAVVVPIDEDGSLREPSALAFHSGSSRHHKRQDAPHPHAIVLDKAEQFAFVPDLGLDKVMQYRFDRASGQLFANGLPWVATEPGSGPRHLVFDSAGKCAYLVGELNSTVTVYSYDRSLGTIEALQTVSMLPEAYVGPNLAADIHLTPDGRFLYASNRGHDTVAAYSVDQESGLLAFIDCFPTEGNGPRGFGIDPAGAFLLVANERSGDLRSFQIDRDSGAIAPTGSKMDVPDPTCVAFMP